MEQQKIQHNAVTIKEEITDTSNDFVKENAASQRTNKSLSKDGLSPPVVTMPVNSNNITSECEKSQTTSKTSIKVKRLLSTLLQFANTLNTDVGETVKTLIFNLACNIITVEEFHSSLQDATNFPLRPFVMPFLKNHVPILQKEIAIQAKLAKQNVQQYIRQHENCALDTFCASSAELPEIFNRTDSLSSNNQAESFSNTVTTKRRHECHENNVCHKADSPPDSQIQTAPPAKKTVSLSACSLPTNGLGAHHSINSQQPSYYTTDYFQVSPPSSLSSGSNWLPATVSLSSKDSNSSTEEKKIASGESEWNNIYVMLNCILSMVEKTKRALVILQGRNISENSNADAEVMSTNNINGEHHSMNRRSTVDDVKKTANDLIAFTVRLTEERVGFVKRKAEEAVNEVKRQAILELQKAIAICEGKATDYAPGNIFNKSPLSLHEIKKQFTSISNSEQDYSGHNGLHEKYDAGLFSQSPTNNCWNCGRKSQETCSGCNVARYCGSFCQHKDWESHHQICNTYINSSSSSAEKLLSCRPIYVDSFFNRVNAHDTATKANATDTSVCRSQSTVADYHNLLPFSVNGSSTVTTEKQNTRTTNTRPLTPLLTTTTTTTTVNSLSSTKIKK